jgi:gustatory receptor
LFILLFQYNVLTIVIPIDSTLKEAKKFVDLCYKLQEQFIQESKEIEVLSRLVDHSKNFKREFSAAGFFDINKSIIFSLVGNVATYLIITIQLNQSQRQQIVVKN